jgi:hypothetical protein
MKEVSPKGTPTYYRLVNKADLRSAGYDVHDYMTAREFLIDNRHHSRGVVVADVRLQGMTGLCAQLGNIDRNFLWCCSRVTGTFQMLWRGMCQIERLDFRSDCMCRYHRRHCFVNSSLRSQIQFAKLFKCSSYFQVHKVLKQCQRVCPKSEIAFPMKSKHDIDQIIIKVANMELGSTLAKFHVPIDNSSYDSVR